MAYFTLHVHFSNSALFHLIFRTLLVRFPQRGLVLQGNPNLKLFNQLFGRFWSPNAALASCCSRSTASSRALFQVLCLCKPVLKENIVAQNIVTLTTQVLASNICAYWTFNTNQFLRSLCPRKKMSCIGNFRRNFTTLNQTTGYIKFNSYYHLLHQRIVFRVSQVAFKVTSETNVFISMITDFL